MASFTFDENDPGSVVVIPRKLMKVEAGGALSRSATPTICHPSFPRWCCRPGISTKVGSMSGPGWLGRPRRDPGTRGGEGRPLPTASASFDGPVPTHLVLSNLARNEPGSHTFLVDGFVGSSPELLVSSPRDGCDRSRWPGQQILATRTRPARSTPRR